MRSLILMCIGCLMLTACGTPYRAYNSYAQHSGSGWDEKSEITESLFNDKSSTITEENIKKILNGNYKLPEKMRVAIVKIRPKTERRSYYNRSDEEYLKTQQSYIQQLTAELKGTGRVTEVMVLPELLLSESPTFTTIRESSVRMQADVVLVYSIRSDVYCKYKVFTKDDIKAFATTEVLLLDNRTGLIPFSTVVTRDVMAYKVKGDTGDDEASKKLQSKAATLTINEVGSQLNSYFKEDKY